ncbi:MAG: CocE/NonD family hydrolase [Candidatus Freyarchaeum deiterrae]
MKKVLGEGSQPKFSVKVDKDVSIKMRDGVKLAADVYRPDAAGKFPALLSVSPYDKDIQNFSQDSKGIENLRKDPEGFMKLASIEAGNSEYFVKRGYVHVIANARGSFKSEGEYQGTFSTQEQKDGYDLIEWIARQPWCNRKVGMVGVSYYAIIQYLIASMNRPPPHLKAIFPLDGFTDLYRDLAYHGGICNTGFPLAWFKPLKGKIKTKPQALKILGNKLKKAVQELLESDAIKNRPEIVEIIKNPELNPILFDMLLAPTDGPIYWERSSWKRLRKIKIPTFIGSDWMKVGIHLRGAFTAYESIKAPKKMLIGPPGMTRPWNEYHDVIVRWYDYWLKDMATGIMDESPIKIFYMGIDQWREEDEWPPAVTQWKKYYLHDERTMDTHPPGPDEKPESYVYEPLNQMRRGLVLYSARYHTPILDKEVKIAGPIALNLYASSTDTDSDWIIRLEDINPDGTKRVLTRGWLKASHRDLDRIKSKPCQPFHPHNKVIPIKSDKIYQYQIEIWPTANVFKAGHKIGLEISSDDGEAGDFSSTIFTHLLSGRKMTNTIFHNPHYPSHLLLPII